MTNTKLSVGILCGGRSPEHEVSLSSARTVYEVLDKDKYEVTLIRLEKSGFWNVIGALDKFQNEPMPGPCPEKLGTAAEILQGIVSQRLIDDIDVMFPLVHGDFGEDGCLQGMLRLLNIPFVGADVLGSAVSMDKDVMKRLLNQAGLPTVDYMVANIATRNQLGYGQVTNKLGEPFFIKPANAGSSIGVSKVQSDSEFESAVDNAFLFDSKIVLERAVMGREFECAVLGGDKPIASSVGEVLFNTDFYSYEAKYADGIEIPMSIPASLPEETTAHFKQLAIKAYATLECFGFGRVDLFLSDEGKTYVNELNTLPCLSHNFPRLWEACGVSLTELLDKLIQLAVRRHRIRNNRRHVFNLGS